MTIAGEIRIAESVTLTEGGPWVAAVGVSDFDSLASGVSDRMKGDRLGMAAVDPDQLRDLIGLAQRRAGDSRRALFENISDLFVSAEGQLSDRERALMRDILAKLVSEIETEVRRSLAERLAQSDDAPADLVSLLAHDEIAVARPILLNSRLLDDPDLIEIVRHRTLEHRMAVAAREGLTADVTDALVDYGEDDVIARLVENHDAEISQRAMDYLVDQSRRVDRFREPLLRRPDLPPVLAHRMFWWVSAALRHHILETFSVDVVELDEQIEQATESVVARAGGGEALSPADRLAAEMQSKNLLTERFLVQALREGQVSMFVAGLALLLDVGSNTANHLVYDPGGEGLALACKAIDFGRANFATVFLLTRGAYEGHVTNVVTNPQKLNEILRFFDGVPRSNAKTAIRYWHRDSAYIDAIEELDRKTTSPQPRLATEH